MLNNLKDFSSLFPKASEKVSKKRELAIWPGPKEKEIRHTYFDMMFFWILQYFLFKFLQELRLAILEYLQQNKVAMVDNFKYFSS